MEKINKEQLLKAIEMLDKIIKDLVAERGITEELKAKGQFAWIAAMEQIKHTAEEMVFNDLKTLTTMIIMHPLSANQSRVLQLEWQQLMVCWYL